MQGLQLLRWSSTPLKVVWGLERLCLQWGMNYRGLLSTTRAFAGSARFPQSLSDSTWSGLTGSSTPISQFWLRVASLQYSVQHGLKLVAAFEF